MALVALDNPKERNIAQLMDVLLQGGRIQPTLALYMRIALLVSSFCIYWGS